MGCIAAVVTACLIFCLFGLFRKRKKTILQKTIINGGGGGGGNATGIGMGGLGSGVGGGGVVPGVSINISGNIGTLKKGATASSIKKDNLFIDPCSWHGLQPVEYIHVDRETTVWYVLSSVLKMASC